MTSVNEKETTTAALLLSSFAEIAREEVKSSPIRKCNYQAHPPLVSPESTSRRDLPIKTEDTLKVDYAPHENFSTEKKAGIPHFNPRSSTKMTKSFVLRPRAISSMERSKNFTFMMPSNITASSSHCPMPSQHHPSQLDTRRNYGFPNMPVVVEQSPSYRQAYASKRPPPAADDSPVINDCCTSPTTPVGNARHVMTYDQHFPISPPYFSSPVSTNPINFKRGEPNARTVLHRKFSWKNYPELEAFLVANRKEYLHHSQLNYTATQKQYNNRLTERLIKLAEESGYEFDPTEFNFVAIRDRIRCYFKSYVQSNKKKGIIVGYKAAKAQLEQDM